MNSQGTGAPGRAGSWSSPTRRRFVAGAITVALASMSLALSPTAQANHADFDLSDGIYRIPYVDGTDVSVNQDNHTHGGVNGNKDRVDLGGGSGTEIVAAANGIVRAVVDHNGSSPNAGDGADKNGDPQDDSLEHSCQDDVDEDGNRIPDSVVTGLCQDYNNYVWIEHPNGEWTKYTHLGTGTATERGWAVGDAIQAGDVIGEEGDIGSASGPHLHWEVAVPDDPTDPTPFSEFGGFISGDNKAALVCDIAGDPPVYVQGDVHEAQPCDHEPPTADAGGPYVVDEGTPLQLDGSASSDPEGRPLTYLWSASGELDDPSSPTPSYTTVDGPSVDAVTLTVYDQVEQLDDSDDTTVTVNNVAPAVDAYTGGAIEEGESATVGAGITDPGTTDTHTATVDWGDGTSPEAVSIGDLAGGVSHAYGDNGAFEVTVTATDDDGGVGSDTVVVTVGNVAPEVTLDAGETVVFPGGEYTVVEEGGTAPFGADGTDDGSDDLTFDWSNGESTTYFNDGVGPDPLPSPGGEFPFAASDEADVAFGDIGVGEVAVTLSDDDDGGTDEAASGVLVTGTEDDTRGSGWWKKQFAPKGNTHIDEDTALAYLEIVRAVSSVFDEEVALGSHSDAHAVLSPNGGDRRARATAELLTAWLELASGAVPWDASVDVSPGVTVGFLDLMAEAESVILDPGASSAELHDVEQQLAKVRHAH